MSYEALAPWYDAFTRDVPYDEVADWYLRLLRPPGRPAEAPMTLLDLCCGTGNLTLPLARRGHELIGVDLSPEMLAVAAAKAGGHALRVPPLFLCQGAAELDLYGTVEGAVCALDGLNYLPPEELPEVFRRLHLFLEPGGVFAFDIQSPEHLRELDGEVFVDETEEALCLWRGDYDPELDALVYGMDIFHLAPEGGGRWLRESEEHVEYAHAPETLCGLLAAAGFTDAETVQGGPPCGEGRRFLRAVNLPH